MSINILAANISPAQQKYLPKDNYKSTNANCILVTEGSTGASGEYLRLWKEQGGRTDPQAGDVCFISANGKRRGGLRPPIDKIIYAAALNCTFLTDARCRRPEGGNSYNTGEQLVADLLRSLGYEEREEFNGLVCRWTRK